MKTPENLMSAAECGVIEEVVRPLMSGKEAQVYLVIANGIECVAKVYKEASQRTFKHRAEYTEGRRTRNSRDQRAMGKRSRHGKTQDEAGWRSTEVDMICRLGDAGVRVPQFINFVDGVLVMEFIKDANGDPAPRLGDLSFTPTEARTVYKQLLREATRMLCAGVIHGDLSEFNVLMDADGPVVIDFPQSLEAARNQNARKFLLRDVANLHRFVERYAPLEPTLCYGEEMWELYEANRLDPDTELRGDYQAPDDITNTSEVLALIEDAAFDDAERREARGEAPRQLARLADAPSVDAPPSQARTQLRKVVNFAAQTKPRPVARKPVSKGQVPPARTDRRPANPATTRPATAEGNASPKKRRNRRGRKSPPGAAGSNRPANASEATRGSRIPAPHAEKQPLSSGETQPAKRRRRGARKPSSNGAVGEKATAPSVAEHPPQQARQAKPVANHPAAAAGDAHPPARRRRRRPRTSGSGNSS